MVSPNAIIVSREESGVNRVTGYISIFDSNNLLFSSYDELFHSFVLKDHRLCDFTPGPYFSVFDAWAPDKIKLQEDQQVEVGLWELTPFGVSAEFSDADSFTRMEEIGITEADMDVIYDIIAGRMDITQRITHISNWLDSIDHKRKKLEDTSFIDDL